MKKGQGFLCLIVAAFIMVWLGMVNALAWPVPDTGQTTCYNVAGNVLNPCPAPGEALYGQDASYTINPMSYTKLDADGDEFPPRVFPLTWSSVRDNVTGLIWEVKHEKDGMENYADPNDADNTYTWYDSNSATNGGDAGESGDGVTTFDTEQYINALNAANYGGHNDWRLPTVTELSSIINYSISNPGPTINDSFFPNTVSSWYWSSTTNPNDGSKALTLRFNYGIDDYYNKYNKFYVRAVCGGTGLLPHLKNNGNGTVTDMNTGLMWQQENSNNTMNWETALSTCESLNLAGYTDWRLPSFKDLRSLVDNTLFDPSINIVYFPGTAALFYWSSTTNANTHGFGWVLNFSDGQDSSCAKVDSSYVRAVRSGQGGPLGHSVISSPRQGSSWTIGAVMPIRWDTDELETNVRIFLSRQGGKDGTFETIIDSTPNDGQYDWTVAGPPSVNCVIKVEQADNTANWATEGLFVIKAPVNPAMYLLLLE